MAETPPPSEQVIYLHGDIELHIIEARHLPNMDLVTGHLRRCLSLESCSKPGGGGDKKIGLYHRKIITRDPYVKVSVPQATLARTRVLSNSLDPKWDEHFNIPIAHPLVSIKFQVKDDNSFGADVMGNVLIPAKQIALGEAISGWFSLIASWGKQPKPDTALHLSLKFTPCDSNPLYRHGIAGDPAQLGVRHTYFPVRKGSSVTLYQDAHVTPECKLPEIELDGGRVFQHSSCWEDICYAISEAHHMIYLVGWSIYHKIKLVREPTKPLPQGGDLTLGEMLKYKSEGGVRVLMLVWDDKTSNIKFFINKAGVMATHDEETRKFFEHSSVICVLSPRYGSSKLSFLKQQASCWNCIYTPSEMCARGYSGITAFIGGLDLCDGRYDTPQHRLFRDLDTVFKDDYHQPTFSAGTKAPRQPWHDLHSRLEGPAAYDVLMNFEQRWKRATRWKEFRLLTKTMSHWHDDSLIKIERISGILSPSFHPKSEDYTVVPKDDPLLYVSKEDHPENWHVQIFRSIDSGSLKGFPITVDVAEEQNLICSKNLLIDKSIQTAYIQAIRSAQHFIYIENQYFIGSSYAWPRHKDAGAKNLIPMELALKIASKIRAKERFAVYIVMPLWPEGVPTTAIVQKILFWQYQTMQTMYEVVARELQSMQMDSHPQNYLNFYCLGNREELPIEAHQSSADEKNYQVSDSQKFQRFMIYVHAKGMIVDDEYVIVGSANINQRSLAGTKDTEIAMGSYQPHHTWAVKKRHPRGQVYGYRMSLWTEHLGMLENCFKEPETLECVKRVNTVAEENWTRFTSENFSSLQGHLLKYPVQVDADGKVDSLPGHENFPDVGGKIIGAHSPTMPDILTT